MIDSINCSQICFIIHFNNEMVSFWVFFLILICKRYTLLKVIYIGNFSSYDYSSSLKKFLFSSFVIKKKQQHIFQHLLEQCSLF